ncbi:AAA family ATPase [Myroides odoratimimus]|nr:AAA family ATPase [Myroides odoratimimus]MDM1504841.1 AAA family ATPase [Myroides odoratimimus]MDM1515407.1 AAA family ATPase [Myroides odoratimimus]
MIQSLDRFFERNTERDNLSGIGKISCFTNSLFVLRNKRPFFEIILEEKNLNIGDTKIVVYFVRAKKNAKKELQEFTDLRDGKWLDKNPFDIQDQIDFTEYLTELLLKTVEEYDKIPTELVQWQDEYHLNIVHDIYESVYWVNFATSNSHSDGMRVEDSKLFLQGLKSIVVQKKLGNELHRFNQTSFYHFHSDELNIEIYYMITLIDNRNIYILFGGGHSISQKVYIHQIKGFFEQIFTKKLSTLQDISEFCFRAYPSWALKDDDLWTKIQKNSEIGNLSLLPEQTNFLKDFTFPKYINGQAGSGKSTILYYLFANIYYYKCAGSIKGEVLFITENEKLLEYTVRSIYELILNNPEFQLTIEDTDILNLRKHFFSFKNFLFSFLSAEDQVFFTEKLYLDFPKFKQLYINSKISQTLKKRFSAELIWFVTTTYIYGQSLSNKITSSNYEDTMPKDGKEIIPFKEFEVLEKEIIEVFFYKLIEEEKYWTKTTLIQYLITNNLVNTNYEVIFCDESQDFTKIELEFLISISQYSQYNLSEVKQYPIVFAGDALQTVNPTGFRSEVLTSMIYKSLTDPLIGFNLNQKDLSFTPKYNYRSSSTIVTMSNIIQYWRKIKLGENIKEPQEAKRKSLIHQNLTIFLTYDDFLNNDNIQAKVQFKTIIVPVNSEEIEDYIEKYEILKKFKNIISAIDAKGLDFSEVIIWGFGDYYSSHELGIYEEKYLFNKLYVAITRSRNELIIIDSQGSKDFFWDEIINYYISSSWNENSTIKLQKINDLMISDGNEIIQSSENIVEEDAREQLKLGKLNNNISLLTIAANHFIKIGKVDLYYLTLGYIEDLNKNFAKAADYYLNKELRGNIEAKENAIISLWNEREFKKIRSINFTDNILFRVVIALIDSFEYRNNYLNDEDIKLMFNNLELLSKLINKTEWKNDFKEYLVNNIFVFPDTNISIYELTTKLFKNQIERSLKVDIAKLFYDQQKFKEALQVYSELQIKDAVVYLCEAELAIKYRDYEKVITSYGKLIYEDFAKNKKFVINKVEIANKLFEYYINNIYEKGLIFKDLYSHIYIFIAKLYSGKFTLDQDIIDYHEILRIFSVEQKEVELFSFFSYLLKEKKFTIYIYNVVIYDWAKLYINFYETEQGLTDLNDEYKVLCKIHNISYAPFTIKEIENSFKSKHFNSIRIKNFKQYDDIVLKDLGSINLIVGDNNIGKTTLLEALLINEDIKKTKLNLICSYIERAKIIPEKDEFSQEIRYHYNISHDCFKNILPNQSLLNPLFEFNRGKEIHKLNLFINREISEVSIHHSYKIFNLANFSESTKLDLNNLPLMPLQAYGKGYGQDLAFYYDKYILKNEQFVEKEFLRGLNVFIENAVSVVIDAYNNILIRTSNSNILQPLHSFGDGANKLFRILILLTIHKGEVLLLDEIDAGIHFSRFAHFWKVLLDISKITNTQIFATTHNLECIYFLREAAENDQNIVRVIQLIKTNRIKAITYDYENFDIALNKDIELRG